MMQQYMKELEQEPFEAEEFVERLAWRTIAETKHEGSDDEDFNPTLLHESFVQAIKDLTLLQERQQKKCEKLENAVREDEALFFQEVYNLFEQNQQAMLTFQELDGKINTVATKVLHLGDQLDSVNGPRSRVVEAHRLLGHLSEFLSTGPLVSSVFTDPYRIDEAADVIQKLYLISQDFPQKFDNVKRKIERKYCDIEKLLIEEFVRAMEKGDKKRMKEIAVVLSQFKGYSQCVDAYIDYSQVNCLSGKDMFAHLLSLCEYNYEIIQKVFSNPDQVMAKFVLNLYQLKIAEYIEQKLNSKLGTYGYLQTLFELYSNFQDLRRDLQAVIGTRANINIAQIENYGGETFLSEELAIVILQDTKHAFERCQLLSKPNERAANATQILDRLINSLLIEHVDYAVELGLQAIPVVEGTKNPPVVYFFTIVYQANNITHLVEKQFMDLVVPLVENTQKYNDCLQKKKFVLEDTERKINTGLDRCLNAVTTWVKLYLQSEQKKSDFKPDTDDFDTVASPACKSVLNYVSGMIKEINTTLDGNNVSAVLQELGLRLHRVVYDHMLQFQYNTAGAMVAICDLNEYRSCCKQMGPLVTELFETLHALCNLLLVKPENLQQVCSEDSLVNLDKSVLHNFIQLRSDFKVQKQNIFLRS
ncbi:unnamed protein product [Acanthoscelides obtectus]|uniref:Exocyst complex component 5 n=1 Tax=Acanthoscelides obtectus TaxID=200917 RepID=A0A9P0NTF8_ACAOB|nr:unnamed protein product [Acanthoscelides obtectus]CAK1640248.1 Exocyst complex component 5 [Acanthoscelides obtectus]